MGTCVSNPLYDEDELRARQLNKQYAKELQHFQQQLRLQKCHSELDINTGRPRVKIQIGSKKVS
jgi:hypothetical protein